MPLPCAQVDVHDEYFKIFLPPRWGIEHGFASEPCVAIAIGDANQGFYLFLSRGRYQLCLTPLTDGALLGAHHMPLVLLEGMNLQGFGQDASQANS